VVAAESCETAITEGMTEAEDRHAQELEHAYLVTRAKHRTLAIERHKPLVLEGIPVYTPERSRTGVTVPHKEVESLIPLTQPLPCEEAGPSLVQKKHQTSFLVKPSGPMK